jgi:hypothetical protein
MDTTAGSGATTWPQHSGTTFSFVDVEQGVFADRCCEICAARPSVIRVCRWRCPGAAPGGGPAPAEGEAHFFCAAHLLLADALSRRLADA